MKVFISGPMRNKPNGNKEAFFDAEYKLKRLGYSVFNPAWCQYGYNTEFTEDDMHMIDFSALSRCDAIYMLKGWQYSKGAKAEFDHAKILCKAILREGDPITDPLKRDKYDWESFKNKLPDRLDITSKHPRVMKPIDDCGKAMNDRMNLFAKELDIGLGNESDRINSLEGEVEAIKESIGTDNLQEQLEKDFADVYEEFQNTKDQVNDINMGYIKWSSEVSQFDERIEKLEENMKEIAANGGLGLSFNLMNARVSSNKRDISSLRNDIDDIHNWINAHNKILEEQSKQMSDLGSELDDYINDYKEAYKHLDNADEALERRIKALETKLSSLLQGYNSTLNRLKAIEKRLSIKPFYAPTEDEKDDD